MILCLFGFVVFTTGRFMLSCLAFFCGFPSPVKHSDRLAWKRELVYVLLVRLFVYIARFSFCRFFSLPLGVSD